MFNWENIHHHLLKIRFDIFWALDVCFWLQLIKNFVLHFCEQNVMNCRRLISKICQNCSTPTLSIFKKHHFDFTEAKKQSDRVVLRNRWSEYLLENLAIEYILCKNARFWLEQKLQSTAEDSLGVSWKTFCDLKRTLSYNLLVRKRFLIQLGKLAESSNRFVRTLRLTHMTNTHK